VAGETRRKESVQIKLSSPKDSIYVKNEIERPAKIMTQSGSDCRIAALVGEEVAAVGEIDN
jgi:hypothetical protein